ncbi:anoctamin-9 [Pteropus vampyrus]|uniref:Anoctamin n=1 Tax=Pteropus vampyrus TaxID=132908 RepID=A0A6P3RCK8_PTEVA|nr:anoctamin-9 [Pteropus vampyrus]
MQLHVLSPLVPLCLAQELLCCGNELVLLFAPLQGEDSFRILVGTEGDSIPLMEVSASETEAPEPWDYVLVADHRTQRSPRCVRQQQRFLEDLKRKGFRYKVKEDEEKVFFGVQADSRIFDLYRMLLMEPEGPAPRVESAGTTLIPTTTSQLLCSRIRIINFVLNSKTADGDTFHDLVKEKVFETKFPLHKGEEGLKKKWARWRNMVREQPIDDIRNYFGEKVALYFAWLGWYTYMLVPAAVVGLIIFLSGFSLFHASQIRWGLGREEVALELINCPDYKLRPHQHSYLRSTIILILSLFMICLMIGMAHVLVVYRVLAAAVFSNLALPFLEEQVTTAVVVTGALVHYVTILFMTKINKSVALKLCDFEKPRTFSERESKFTVKFFTLQFFTHFSSLVYVAFILGRINGHPGKSVRLAGLWKLEECHLSGCMMDLFVQMAIIMGLKQTLSNCMEYLRPWLALKYRSMRGHESRDPELRDWQRNYRLNPVNTFSLFDEFMEMMIQYGFTTIFVAAFPLAPLLALFSNLVEIRLDAIKMVRLQRRLVPRKAKDIGTWLQVLETIGVLAVIANGMVIAFTSEFIPRVVYKYRYGPCREGARPAVDCLTGYINHSLSVFHTKDFQDPVKTEDSEHVTECRYRDYRNALDYNFSEQFWILLAIRLAFLILFEHVALCIKLVAAWFVPDVPQSVKNRVLEEKYRSLREKLGSSPKSTDV